MPGDIIKFTKARKAKTKAEKDQQASANRAKSGRTREERAKEAANEKLLAERHEGLRLKQPIAPDGAAKTSGATKPRLVAGATDAETPASFAKRKLLDLAKHRHPAKSPAPAKPRTPGDNTAGGDDDETGGGGSA